MSDAREMLIKSLEAVRRSYDADEDDWKRRLLNTFLHYSIAIGIDNRLTDPLHRLLVETDDAIFKVREGKSAKMFVGKRLALTTAAAAVSILKDSYPSIAKATTAVSEKTGIGEQEITNFRNGIHRGSYGPDTQQAYEQTVQKMAAWPKSEMLDAIAGLSRFL